MESQLTVITAHTVLIIQKVTDTFSLKFLCLLKNRLKINYFKRSPDNNNNQKCHQKS